MPYNLLAERWIPVRRRSGRVEAIAPSEIAAGDDAPVEIASPRPDLDGALLQFLIGLMQTTVAPESKKAWRSWYAMPPSEVELRQKFQSVGFAFDLDGDGPRFMQDFDRKLEDDEPATVGALLMDSPGENTIRNNTDLFVKRGAVGSLSYPMVAAALYALQSSAPSGGQGHLTSLRGGGPMTTVVLGKSLFHTIWLNVLRSDDFLSAGDRQKSRPEDIFPWLAPTRTSEKGSGRDTTPDDMHSAQLFWAAPRRIRLELVPGQSGTCDLSGATAVPVVSRYYTRNYGANYKGPFIHPLTPYTGLSPNEPPNPKKFRGDGLPYRDWPQLVTGMDEGQGKSRRPAKVVHAFAADERDEVVAENGGSGPLRVHAFGYHMDKMKPVCWYAGTTPLLVARGHEAEFALAAQQCVAASEEVRRTLVDKVKKALKRRPEDMKTDGLLLSQVSHAFWSETEAAFFATLEKIRAGLPSRELRDAACEEWLKDHLGRAARTVFTAHSQEQGAFAATDVKRVAVAWKELCEFTSWRNARLRAAVNLGPVSELSSALTNASEGAPS